MIADAEKGGTQHFFNFICKTSLLHFIKRCLPSKVKASIPGMGSVMRQTWAGPQIQSLRELQAPARASHLGKLCCHR